MLDADYDSYFVCCRWPYPFLDLSSPYAPLWYVTSHMNFKCHSISVIFQDIWKQILLELVPVGIAEFLNSEAYGISEIFQTASLLGSTCNCV